MTVTCVIDNRRGGVPGPVPEPRTTRFGVSKCIGGANSNQGTILVGEEMPNFGRLGSLACTAHPNGRSLVVRATSVLPGMNGLQVAWVCVECFVFVSS
jgi:hypothetical protein